MKRLLITLFLPVIVSATAFDCCESQDYSFYIKVDSGVSFSELANVSACSPPWNQAVEGYNATLGKAPIIGFSVGCELAHALDVEVNISNRSIFHYRKCQTPVGGGASYKRTFDLDVTSVLVGANVIGRNFSCLNWGVCCGKIYPLFGVGLGASNLLITNFRTTGLPPTGDSAPYASFSSENQYTLRRKFTYTLRAGFEYNHNDVWAAAIGYRWFNAGHFNGPQYLQVASGSAVDVGGAAWGMRFRANEWFVEFRIFI